MTKYFLSVLMTFGLAGFTGAATIIDDAQVVRLYTQTLSGANLSDAHAFSVNKALDDSCQGRLHILPEDKELFSVVLAYQLSGRQFSLMYTTGNSEKHIAGHLYSSCKVISIY